MYVSVLLSNRNAVYVISLSTMRLIQVCLFPRHFLRFLFLTHTHTQKKQSFNLKLLAHRNRIGIEME